MHLLLAVSNPAHVEAFHHAAKAFRNLILEAAAEESAAAGSFEANATAKATTASHHAPGRIVLAEDSGIAMRRLGGAPGIHSYDYADHEGFEHEGTREQCNIACLLDRAANLRYKDVSHFCFLAAARDGVHLATGIGELQGSLIDAPRGDGGAEYDPVFDVLELGMTVAQLDEEARLQCSPHGRALVHLMKLLAAQGLN